MIGKTLAHYRVLDRIGVGGMGEVYRARDTTLDRDVALKVLPPHFVADPERIVRFEREAKVLASLNHSGIAAIYGFHEQDGVRFLAMELVDGPDLSQRLANGPMPVQEALPLAAGIAEAIEYAHERSIVHRDLKPANIKITGRGVKVLDFGLAKAFAPETTPRQRLQPGARSSSDRFATCLPATGVEQRVVGIRRAEPSGSYRARRWKSRGSRTRDPDSTATGRAVGRPGCKTTTNAPTRTSTTLGTASRPPWDFLSRASADSCRILRSS